MIICHFWVVSRSRPEPQSYIIIRQNSQRQPFSTTLCRQFSCSENSTFSNLLKSVRQWSILPLKSTAIQIINLDLPSIGKYNSCTLGAIGWTLNFNFITRHHSLLRGLQSKLFTITSWLLLLMLIGRLLLINELPPWHCNCFNSSRRRQGQGLSDLKAFVKCRNFRFNLSSCYHCTNLLKLLEDVSGIALAVPHPGWPMFKL